MMHNMCDPHSQYMEGAGGRRRGAGENPSSHASPARPLRSPGRARSPGPPIMMAGAGTPHSPSDGFTLTEIIIVAALFLILGAGLLTTFLTGQASYLSADAYIQVQQEARKAFDNMLRELREAGAEPGNAVQVKLPGNPGRQLDFQIALGYAGGAITWGNENGATQWVHYLITNNQVVTTGQDAAQLVRCATPGQNDPLTAPYAGCRVLANYVDGSTSSFAYDAGNKVVTPTIEVRYRNPRLPGGTSAAAGGFQTTGLLTSRVKLRNP